MGTANDLPRRKAVAICSGGLDSTVLTYYVRTLGYDLHSLSFNYGQRHNNELLFAALTAMRLQIPHKIVDLKDLSSLLSGSALTSKEVEVPEGHYTAENMAITVVPNRNAIMLSIAWGYAVSIGADRVFVGVHAGDHAIYPDCRPEFIVEMNTAMAVATKGFHSENLLIEAPFIYKSKTEIVMLGSKLEVPFDLTWSCYKGGRIHCGRCGTCVERAEAFSKADVPDPTAYMDKEFWKQVTSSH